MKNIYYYCSGLFILFSIFIYIIYIKILLKKNKKFKSFSYDIKMSTEENFARYVKHVIKKERMNKKEISRLFNYSVGYLISEFESITGKKPNLYSTEDLKEIIKTTK